MMNMNEMPEVKNLPVFFLAKSGSTSQNATFKALKASWLTVIPSLFTSRIVFLELT